MTTEDTRTPKFYGPDNVLRTEYIFSTDQSFRTFTGIVDADTVDVQVSLRGGAFTSDPDMVSFEGTEFIIPNPSAFPDGLQLLPGENPIEVRAVMSNGSTSSIGSIQANLSLEQDVKAGVIAPSGIYVERLDQLVQIYVDGLVDTNVTGYQFYASTEPGGGAVGYRRISISPVISGDTYEKTADLGELSVDAQVARDEDGEMLSEPQYIHMLSTQVDRTGTIFQTDLNQRISIPDTVEQFRTSIAFESVQELERFSFVHNRQATPLITETYPAVPYADFSTLLDTDPIYYVVTALYVIDEKEYESAYSPEVSATPIIVSPLVSSLPSVSRQQIVQDVTLSIHRSHPELDVKPGAMIRDVFVDPFSTEAERIRFILGFVQSCQAFSTLLDIDDPNNTGTSLEVTNSPYKLALKQAFYLQSNIDVQNMIDNAFDKLASQRGAVRLIGKRSRGEITAYVTTKPVTSIFVPLGSVVTAGTQTFRTTSAGYITSTGIGSSYDPVTGRYFIQLFIQAADTGTGGNLAAGQIRSFQGGPAGVLCYNSVATYGGRDAETNHQLATRADGVLSSVDTGTYRGYVQTTNDISGVLENTVVDAGHSLMLRDYNPETEKHTGGKIDVWIRGENLATIKDSFAFSFEIVNRGQFEPLGSLADLRFRAVNSNLSVDNPIMEMLDNEAWGFMFADDTTGKIFDLTDVEILTYDTIQLSADYNDPENIALTDVFRGSYRYRTSSAYVFQRQPVRSLTSLVGTTGTVDPDYYKLFAGSPPLDLGRSEESGDYLQVVQPVGEYISIPSGDPIEVSDERHVLLDGTEYLDNLGINPITVRVYNVERSIEYYGPYHPDGEPDYSFVDESGDYPLGIVPTTLSRFTEGQTISVDYSHDENFVVTYVVNSLVGTAQQDLDATRNIMADVLAKDSFPIGVDITATIVTTSSTASSNVTVVDSNVRTELSRLFGTFSQGTPVRQSDIIKVIDKVDGVSYVVVPLTEMKRTDGSQALLEPVLTDTEIDFTEITYWATDLIKVYILENQLESGCVNGGGEFNETKGVYFNYISLETYNTTPDAHGIPLNRSTYGAYIIGNDGMNIQGYSDDATLALLYPFATDAELYQHRIDLTANRVLVALPTAVTPLDNDFLVTYVVSGDTGVKNINPNSIQYLQLGDLDFTYDEDTDSSLMVSGGRRST